MSDQTTIKHSIVKPVVKSATPKGQLISKVIFGAYKSTKNQRMLRISALTGSNRKLKAL